MFANRTAPLAALTPLYFPGKGGKDFRQTKNKIFCRMEGKGGCRRRRSAGSDATLVVIFLVLSVLSRAHTNFRKIPEKLASGSFLRDAEGETSSRPTNNTEMAGKFPCKNL